MKAMVHAADIGNPTRTFDIAFKWARQIVREFYHQGDKERALGFDISMLCDRHTVNFAGSQIGFINFVIAPYFAVASSLLPKLQYTVVQCKENSEKFGGLKDEYEL